MEKVSMIIRITPKTREKLEKMRKETGLPYGIIIDQLVNNIKTEDNGQNV